MYGECKNKNTNIIDFHANVLNKKKERGTLLHPPWNIIVRETLSFNLIFWSILKKKEKNRDLKERKKDCSKIRTQLSSGKKKEIIENRNRDTRILGVSISRIYRNRQCCIRTMNINKLLIKMRFIMISSNHDKTINY